MDKNAIAPAKMILYHGTEYKNAKSIFQNGLSLHGGLEWSGHNLNIKHSGAIYLTPDIDKAARYAVGANLDKTPIILEIVISNPNKFKRMFVDPLDQSDDAWNQTENNRWYQEFRDQEHYIEKDVEKIIKELVENPSYINFDLDAESLEQLDGMNLYKYIYNWIVNHLKTYDLTFPRYEIMRKIQNTFKPGDYSEYLDIRPDGTLKLSKNFWNNQEQLYYIKNIPPSAIKYVWIAEIEQKEKVLNPIEERKISIKALPHEAANRFEEIRGLYLSLHDEIEDIIDEENMDRLHEYKSNFKFLHDEAGEDLIDEILEFDNLDVNEWEEKILDYENDLNENYYSDWIIEKDIWYKIPVKQLFI